VRILVANPNTGHVCRPGETGEIWITGPSIGLGYWNRPEDSARTFQACTDEGEGPFLRTGDLGFLRDGELFVTGRLKDVLIVRGVKHYPHDLEYTAERQHPAIRSGCVAAFAAGADSSGDRIALVAETDPRRFGAPGAAPDVIAGIRCAVAEFHGVQLHAVLLVGPGAVSKTTSGKLQRFACRAAFIAGTFRALAEWRDGVVSAECL
jgi:acyl-CoA synthetase (AMP-forming)/AMP-acid ligase II